MRLTSAAIASAVAALCACAAARKSPLPFAAARWQSFDAGLPSRGQWLQGFAVADFDGDGKLDIAHGAPRQGRQRPVLYRGDGYGAWQLWEDAQFPPLGYAYGATVAADFDADGHLDLALGMHQRGIAILRGDGAGGFRPWSHGLALGPQAFASRALAVVDWNGDGAPDLAAFGQGPRIGGGASRGLRILLNGGDGTWRELNPLPALRNFGDSIAVGDFDADGRGDLAISSSRLGARDIVLLRRDGDALAAAALPLAERAYVRAVAAVAARDGGGHDLLVAYLSLGEAGWHGHLDLFHRHDGAWTRRMLLDAEAALGITAVDAMRHGDHLDAAALGADGRVILLRASAAGVSTLTLDDSTAPRDGCRGRAVRLRDLDGDGRIEILAAFASAPSDAAPHACRSRGRLRVWTQR
jgi:hypothetical protein